MPPKIFFQSSLPRSGSTLLQNILAQNPAIYATPSSGVLELLYSARATYTNSLEFRAQDSIAMKQAFLAFTRAGMEAYYRPLTNRPYVVDKSRGWAVHFDLLQMIFNEDPKIICMVRNLGQILSSLEKKFRMNPDKHRPAENNQTLTGTTTMKRMVQNLQSTPVGLALDRLKEVFQRGWAKKILFVRYEDLSTDPESTLEMIYQYLGIPAFKHNFTMVGQVTQEDDSVFGIPNLHQIRNKVEPVPNDQIEVLGLDGVRYIQQHYKWYFDLFDYQTSAVT